MKIELEIPEHELTAALQRSVSDLLTDRHSNLRQKLGRMAEDAADAVLSRLDVAAVVERAIAAELETVVRSVIERKVKKVVSAEVNKQADRLVVAEQLRLAQSTEKEA